MFDELLESFEGRDRDPRRKPSGGLRGLLGRLLDGDSGSDSRRPQDGPHDRDRRNDTREDSSHRFGERAADQRSGFDRVETRDDERLRDRNRPVIRRDDDDDDDDRGHDSRHKRRAFDFDLGD